MGDLEKQVKMQSTPLSHKVSIRVLTMNSSWNPKQDSGINKILIDNKKLVLPKDAEKLMILWSQIVKKANSTTSRAIHKVAKGIKTLFKGKKEEKNFDEIEDLKMPKVSGRGSMSKVAEQAAKRFYNVYYFFFGGENKITNIPKSIQDAKKIIDTYHQDPGDTNVYADLVFSALKTTRPKYWGKEEVHYVDFMNKFFELIIKDPKGLGYVDQNNGFKELGSIAENYNGIFSKATKNYKPKFGTYFKKEEEINLQERELALRIKEMRKYLKDASIAILSMEEYAKNKIPEKIKKKMDANNSHYKGKYSEDIGTISSIPGEMETLINNTEKTSLAYKTVVKFGEELVLPKTNQGDKTPDTFVKMIVSELPRSASLFNKCAVNLEVYLNNSSTFKKIIEAMELYHLQSYNVKIFCEKMCKESINYEAPSKNQQNDQQKINTRLEQLATVKKGINTLDKDYIAKLEELANKFKSTCDKVRKDFIFDESVHGWIKYLNTKLLEIKSKIDQVKNVINVVKI